MNPVETEHRIRTLWKWTRNRFVLGFSLVCTAVFACLGWAFNVLHKSWSHGMGCAGALCWRRGEMVARCDICVSYFGLLAPQFIVALMICAWHVRKAYRRNFRDEVGVGRSRTILVGGGEGGWGVPRARRAGPPVPSKRVVLSSQRAAGRSSKPPRLASCPPRGCRHRRSGPRALTQVCVCVRAPPSCVFRDRRHEFGVIREHLVCLAFYIPAALTQWLLEVWPHRGGRAIATRLRMT